MRFVSLIFVFLLLSGPAQAQARMSGTYASFGIGGWEKSESGTYTSNDFSTVLRGAVGFRKSFLRAEFDVSQWDNGSREGFTGSFTTASLNAFIHVMPRSLFSPYVGGGFGYMFADEGNSPFYMLIGGLELSPRYSPIGVAVEYRYLKPTKEIQSHDFDGDAILFQTYFNF